MLHILRSPNLYLDWSITVVDEKPTTTGISFSLSMQFLFFHRTPRFCGMFWLLCLMYFQPMYYDKNIDVVPKDGFRKCPVLCRLTVSPLPEKLIKVITHRKTLE